MSATADTRAYRGETLEDALRQVREELGPEAIVVKQREGIIGGVGGFFGKRCVEIEVKVPSAPAEADIWAEDSWTESWPTPRVLPPRAVIDLYDTGVEPDQAPVEPAAESWPWPMPYASTLPLGLAEERDDRAVTAEMEALDDVAQQSPLVRTLLEQASPFADELAQAVELVELAPLQAATPEPFELEVLPEPAPEPTLLPVLAAEPQPLPVQIFDPAGMQRRLTSSGLDERLAREVVAQAESELRFFDPTEPFGQQVRTVLARRIRVARAPRKSGRRVIALVGPSGSGKTLTAARLCYAHCTVAGRSVAALSLEPVREAFELARHTKGLDVELVVADESATLEQKLEKLSSAELLVVDTPAVDPQDEDRLHMLALLLELIGPDETHLLVPAALGTTDVGVLLDTVAPALGADRLLVTHRDGPGGLGAAVSASIRSKLPISFTATGNAWGLRPADPYELAGLVVQ